MIAKGFYLNTYANQVQLCNALLEENFKLAEELLLSDVDLILDQNSNHPFHIVCEKFNIRLIRLMLDFKKVDINLFDKLGYTALHRAAANGHRELIYLLIKYGATIDLGDLIHGNTALHYAAWSGFSKSVELLCHCRANPNISNKDKFTPLHMASQNGHNQCVRILLYAGSDVNCKNRYGDTALHTASRYGHDRIVQILLTGRIQLDQVNKNGDNALHIAVALKHTTIVDLLLAANSELLNRNISQLNSHMDLRKMVNSQNETPLDIACRKHYHKLAQAILWDLRNEQELSKASHFMKEELYDDSYHFNVFKGTNKTNIKTSNNTKQCVTPNTNTHFSVNESQYDSYKKPSPQTFLGNVHRPCLQTTELVTSITTPVGLPCNSLTESALAHSYGRQKIVHNNKNNINLISPVISHLAPQSTSKLLLSQQKFVENFTAEDSPSPNESSQKQHHVSTIFIKPSLEFIRSSVQNENEPRSEKKCEKYNICSYPRPSSADLCYEHLQSCLPKSSSSSHSSFSSLGSLKLQNLYSPGRLSTKSLKDVSHLTIKSDSSRLPNDFENKQLLTKKHRRSFLSNLFLKTSNRYKLDENIQDQNENSQLSAYFKSSSKINRTFENESVPINKFSKAETFNRNITQDIHNCISATIPCSHTSNLSTNHGKTNTLTQQFFNFFKRKKIPKQRTENFTVDNKSTKPMNTAMNIIINSSGSNNVPANHSFKLNLIPEDKYTLNNKVIDEASDCRKIITDRVSFRKPIADLIRSQSINSLRNLNHELNKSEHDDYPKFNTQQYSADILGSRNSHVYGRKTVFRFKDSKTSGLISVKKTKI